jgi:hypothetical protein
MLPAVRPPAAPARATAARHPVLTQGLAHTCSTQYINGRARQRSNMPSISILTAASILCMLSACKSLFLRDCTA